MSYLVIQILGIFALLVESLSYWFKTKKKMLFIQIIADIFFILHYLFLDAVVGCAMCIVALMREILFYFSKNKKQEQIICKFIILMCFALGIFTYKTFLGVFPIAAAITYTYTLTMASKWIVMGGIINYSYWLLYDIISGSIAGIINDLFVIVSNTISLIKRRLEEKKKAIK